MRRALADRRLELGTIRALAADLGVSESAAARLLKNGPPRRWSDAQLERFAEDLYARAHRNERDRRADPRGAQEVMEAKRKAPVFSWEAQVAAVAQLKKALADLEGQRACEQGNWTPRVALARELGVTSVRLGRWVRAGHVPAESMERVHEWALQRADAELRRIAVQARVGELIQDSKKPGWAPALTGAKAKPAARAPDMKTSEGPTESEEQSGYLWVLRVEEWSSFALVDRMCKWALGRQRKGPLARPASRWIVTAFLSLYAEPGTRDRRLNIRGKRSPGAYRQFESPRDREIGRSLELGAVASSGHRSRGGLEAAVALFRERMAAEHCDHELVFVHGVLVRNWRVRGDAEKKAYRARQSAKFFNERKLAEQTKAAADDVTRAAARKKALGRGRSRSGGARARGKKKRS